jgi:dTDP-4-amino-4,6-dideoxygalactose transaminase
LVSNGTIALITALQTLRITGEVITTPYSFVATAHSLLWNNIRPVFVDIDARTMNIDPERIEEAITPETSAILAVHCYGTPCNVQRIQQIADIYGLKVIYDAAHAFAVRLNGESVLRHGDLSTLSMHATKTFNTIEGGAIVCGNAKTKMRIDYLKNFGFADEVTVVAPGINGKMNELQAAFGLLQLKYIDAAIEQRGLIDQYYRASLGDIQGITIPEEPLNTTRNYGYFPILVTPGYSLTRDELYQALRHEDVFARRYFYPLISDMPMYRGMISAHPDNLPVAGEIARKVICLPIYPNLAREDQQRVIDIVRKGRG